MSQVALSGYSYGGYYSVQDSRDCNRTCRDRAIACLRHLIYGGTFLRRLCCSARPEVKPTVSPLNGRYVSRSLPWNDENCKESGGLCIFLHGLKASVKQWEKYTREFSKHFPKMHYLPGVIFKAGNCPIESAGDPFVAVIEEYLEKFPRRPITLISTSNGSRIAAYIETRVKPEKLRGNRISSFCIASAGGGTRLMILARKVFADKLIGYHPDIARDLSFNSERSNRMLRELNERQAVWASHGVQAVHHFFATLEDEKVRPISSSLPCVDWVPQENYHLICGETHETVVDSVQPEIFKIMKQLYSV